MRRMGKGEKKGKGRREMAASKEERKGEKGEE